ncbi:MAG TPA: SIMPL domain-containing protein [Bryobacteraceae bacterium]|jgi:hypothetical protein|nr:SIMPL domain-containing protein [Bryobacteraceae bacterium]
MRALALFSLLTISSAFAQAPAAPHFVRASGEATVTAKPDRASIDIGVVTHASTAQAASEQNAAQTSQVLEIIRQALRNGGEVKTSNYTLAPQYDYANNRPARLTGYDATNSVLVTVDDLSLLGKIIDAATKSGTNNIAGISFTLKDDTAVRAAALREATIRARANAEVIAKALDVQIVGVLQAEPSEAFPVRPLVMPMQTFEMRQAPATPIAPGGLDVHAMVTVTLETR